MHTVIESLNEWGLQFTTHARLMFVQVGLLMGLLWLLDWVGRRRLHASLRYAIWLLVLVKLALSPQLSVPTGIGHWVPRSTPAVPSVSKVPTSTQVSPEETVPSIFHTTVTSVDSSPEPFPAEPANLPLVARASSFWEDLTWRAWVLLGWGQGVFLLALIQVYRVLSLRRVIEQSYPAPEFLHKHLRQCQHDMSLSRTIDIRITNKPVGPAVCRTWKPLILLPKTLVDQLPEDKLRTILLHELCHIQREDLWVNHVQTCLQVFYFYNPLVWLANGIIRRLREQAVDDRVLQQLEDQRQCYGHALIDIAEWMAAAPSLRLRVIGVVESKTRLYERIQRMLHCPIPRKARLGWCGLVTVVLLGCLLLPMARSQEAMRLPVSTSGTAVSASLERDITQAMQQVLKDFLGAFNKQDIQGVLALCTDDFIQLPDGADAIIGKDAMHAQLARDFQQGLMIQSIDDQVSNLWVCGDLIYVVEDYKILIKVPNSRTLLTDCRKGFTLWQRQADGSVKMKLDVWNQDALPNPGEQIDDQMLIQQIEADSSGELSQELVTQIEAWEEDFHHQFIINDDKAAMVYIDPDAIFLPWGKDAVQGRWAIHRFLKKGMAETELEKLDRQVLQVGGNNQMVYVVNRMAWTFKDPSTGKNVTFGGKGIHVWKRQTDGSWKIFIDIYNMNAPI